MQNDEENLLVSFLLSTVPCFGSTVYSSTIASSSVRYLIFQIMLEIPCTWLHSPLVHISHGSPRNQSKPNTQQTRLELLGSFSFLSSLLALDLAFSSSGLTGFSRITHGLACMALVQYPARRRSYTLGRVEWDAKGMAYEPNRDGS